MDTKETDQRAWEAHASGMTWAQVALEMHYANGSVARRAAMRHAARHGLTDGSAEQRGPSPEAIAEALGRIKAVVETPEFAAIVNDDVQPAWTKGQRIYHRDEPKATFEFVKWNADGSAQVWGGERGYAAYRDFRVDAISIHPFDGSEAALQWALANVGAEQTTEELAERFDMAPPAIRRLTAERPDVFRRVGRGRFQMRNPQADRAADKQVAS